MYVPLGLVERKRQTRRGDDVSPEQGSLLYEETEITQRFEHEQFLEQVLRQGESPKSGGKRIAIIGEPGAGKTTLLQQIAQWVSEQIEGAIAIWVSLADLRGQELEAYLLERWLQAVARKLGQAEASRQVKDAFVAQFQQGRVWLLLDGVDEMQVPSGNPLAEIERQVRMGGLLSQARIVLSCRLNLWDGDRNALDTFDTYRTLEFSYPQQVEQFIGQWFRALPEGQGEQAERLCAALKAPGKERIRDLVKNPLRLTLLCFNRYLGEGTLPETKAGLYEQFVADFYEWKREHFSTTVKQQRQLNAALGELAREAIDREATRFRLRHEFVCEFLGEPDEPDSLFGLALRLGWLNKVGVEAENPRKGVYAFFHPTFQEYFAALGIDNWHFLLNHIPDNTDHVSTSYRVFDPQWKEVFLLWLGRNTLSTDSKRDLIQALVKFEDRRRSFYWEKAILLVAEGIAEFEHPTYTKKTVEQLVIWSFGYFDFDRNEWKNFLHPLAEEAKQALIKTNRCLAILEVIDFIQYCPEELYKRYRAIQLLGELGSGNSRVIEFLENLLENSQDKWTALQAAESLLKINSSHEKAVNILFLAFEREDIRLAEAAAKIIKGIEIKSLTFVPRLVDLVLNYKTKIEKNDCSSNREVVRVAPIAFAEIIDDENICGLAIQCLGSLGAGDNVIANALLDFLKQFDSRHIRCKIVESLGKIGTDSSSVVTTLIELLETSQEWQLSGEIVKSLGTITTKSSAVINALINSLYNYTHWANFRTATESLSKILVANPERNEEIIDIFSEILLKEKHPYITVPIFNCLGVIASGNQKAVHIIAEELSIAQSENTRYFIAKNLAKIDPKNENAISALEDLLNKSGELNWQGCIASVELGEILPSHQNALDYLLDAILHQKMPLQPRYINENFLRIGIIAQPDEVTSLTSFLDSSQGTQAMVRVVYELKKVFKNQERENDPEYLEIYYRVLWYCTQHLPYQHFYKAWMAM
ncbi:NACHT domain-containing protein [Microcoleus sp. T3_A4]|uniref:NACHT domain-containing protein n=1 Tax=Microcoleus sp. T3_A4 TaxID=2818968 RepID=UPI002FD0D3E0